MIFVSYYAIGTQLSSQIVVNKNGLLIEMYVIFAKKDKPELVQGNATKTRKTTRVTEWYCNTIAGENNQNK